MTFTATVAATTGTAQGTVTFYDGSKLLGASTLDVTGKAVLAVSSLTAVSHNITAVYAGNANYATSSGSFTQAVNKASLSITANPQTRAYGQVNPTFTGAISGAYGPDGITASYSTTATQADHPGSYTITPSANDPNSKLSNYNVTINTAT